MSNDNESKRKKAIARLGLWGTAYFGTLFLQRNLPAGAIATLGISPGCLDLIFEAFKPILARYTANAIDAVRQGKEPEPNLLANEDLTKAVGRAIAAIIALVAEDKTNGYDQKTRRHLQDIAKVAKDNWVEIAPRKIADYAELREHRLDEMLTGEGESLTKETALTPDIWLDVLAELNRAAKVEFSLEPSVLKTVAQQLHTNFPKALRQALKEDFKADGRAFAGLVLSLLTDLKREVATLKLSEAELEAVNGRLGEVSDRLKVGEEQQRAFFREIADKIDSGFAEVCRRFDVHETNITQLLAALDDRLKEIGGDVKEVWKNTEAIKQSLNPEPPTRQQWEDICKQMLKSREELTTGAFARAGVSPIIKDLYVPLALVERREKPQVKAKSPERKETQETNETEEKLVPVTEDEFLREVLQLGKSKISGGKRIAIVGEPGSGKTTRLQFIANWILEKHLGLPVWVSLRDLDGKDVSSFLENSAWKHPLPGVKVEFEQLTARAEEVWLLLDGLDEMTARIETGHVEKLLGGWIPEARVIVTCRTNVWEADRNAFSGFDVFRNLEFAPKEVEDYIGKWFGAMEKPSVGEELLAQLAQSPNQRLRDLIGNPLRLWMLCQIWHPKAALPQTQAELYRRFANWMYKWEKSREFRKKRKEIDGALAKLALSAMENPDDNSRLRLGESWVTEIISEDTFEAVKRLGWLNVVGYDDKGDEAVYGFYHLTFLEYFAALAVPGWQSFLNHVPGKPEQGVYRVFAPEWKQVILLWLGRDDVEPQEKEEFVRALVEFEDGCGEWNFNPVERGFYEYPAYFLAAAGINEFRDCSLAEEIVDQIVRWGFGYFDEEKQEWMTYLAPIETDAKEVLKETIRDRAITALEELLATSTDEWTRGQAAKSLWEIAPGNEKVITALIEILATSTDEWTRGQAAWSLGEIASGNEKAITALIEILAITTDEFTRSKAANCLGKIGSSNEKAITALVELLETSTDKYTHRQAAKSLGQIGSGNEKAITALVQLMAISTDKYTARKAAESLWEIASGNEKAITALVKLLTTSTDERIHLLAAESLEQIAPGNEKAITALVELISNTQSEDVRAVAAYLLGLIDLDNNIAITALVELIKNTQSEDILCPAAMVLEEIDPGNSTAIAAMVKLISNTKSEEILCKAIVSLTKIGDRYSDTAITALVKFICNYQDKEAKSDWPTLDCDRSDCIVKATMDSYTALCLRCGKSKSKHCLPELLGKMAQGNSTAIATLVELLGNSQPETTRWFAAWSLGKIELGNNAAVTALVELIRNTQSKDIRQQAAYSLGQIAPGNEKAITALVELLATTTDEKTRTEAAESLRQIAPGNEKAITALVELLATDENTRWQAAYSLGQIASGNETAITALVELLVTGEDTRWRAAESLPEILETNEQYCQVVSKLKHCLSDQTYQNNFDQFDKSYSLIWHCAQNLPYPEFYRAWHDRNPDDGNPTPQTLDTPGI